MKERNFKFRKSYAEVIRVMDDKQAGRFIKAVSDYVFDGRAYDGNDTAIKSAFTLVKVSLDGDKADRENGRRGGIKSRVIMAPEHAKRLLQALQSNVYNYEQAFGKIKLADEPERTIAPFGTPKGEA